MSKRKIKRSLDPLSNFGGYEVKENYNLLKESKVNWGKSDFVEMNELCRKTNKVMSYNKETNEYRLSIRIDEDITINTSDSTEIGKSIKKRKHIKRY